MTKRRTPKDLLERLDDEVEWSDSGGALKQDDAVALLKAAREEIRRLRERLGPRGLEVVTIGGAGHYVNEAVRDELNRLRAPLSSAELRLVDKNCDWIAFKHAWSAVMKSRGQSGS